MTVTAKKTIDAEEELYMKTRVTFGTAALMGLGIALGGCEHPVENGKDAVIASWIAAFDSV